jgi:hypothetical protein
MQNHSIKEAIALYQSNNSPLKNSKLYLFKQSINENTDFLTLIPLVQKEAQETTIEFVKATMLLGWERTQSLFNALWKYIALVELKQTLKKYYGKQIDVYLQEEIDQKKEEIDEAIEDIMTQYMGSKQGVKRIYDEWTKEGITKESLRKALLILNLPSNKKQLQKQIEELEQIEKEQGLEALNEVLFMRAGLK